MHGVMGLANAQRTLTYLRILTQFVSQPQYKDVVQMYDPVRRSASISLTFEQCGYCERNSLGNDRSRSRPELLLRGVRDDAEVKVWRTLSSCAFLVALTL